MSNWNNDAIQFPRLLSEIRAVQEVDFGALSITMGLSFEQIQDLFDRADLVWENIKVEAAQTAEHHRRVVSALTALMATEANKGAEEGLTYELAESLKAEAEEGGANALLNLPPLKQAILGYALDQARGDDDDENSGTNMAAATVLRPWFDRMAAAVLAAKGLTQVFHTSYQDVANPDEQSAPYHAHAGQQVEITELIVDPTKCPFDEESLPYYRGRFAGGVELVIGDEEVFTRDPRLLELANAMNGAFGIARDMGYGGPFHLAEEGSEAEKARFMKEVLTFSCEKPVNFNTPAEFRPPVKQQAA